MANFDAQYHTIRYNICMVRLVGALYCMFLMGCGQIHHDKAVVIDAAFVPQIEQFNQASNTAARPNLIQDLSVQFGDVQAAGCNEGKWGCCHTQADTTPAIVIDKTEWDLLDKTDVAQGRPAGTFKTLLMFHELGHCVLGRQHKDEMHAREVPASVMETDFSSYLPSYFNAFQNDYEAELLGEGAGPEPFGP